MPALETLLVFAAVSLGMVLTPGPNMVYLGFVQICVSVAVNAAIVMAAAHVAGFRAARPLFARIQRWVMGTVLAGLAARMAPEARP